MEILAARDDTARALGTLDPELLRWVEREDYISVSPGRRTLPQHLQEHLEAGGDVPGISLLRCRYCLCQILEDLILIWEAGCPRSIEIRLNIFRL